MYLRTQETEDRYSKANNTECYFCKCEVIRDFGDFFITINNYPYDKVATTHHLLATKEHISKLDLKKRKLLSDILETLSNEGLYHSTLTNFNKNMSCPNHWHCHLLVWKL